MAVGKVATFTFENQIRSDYTSYYWRKKLFWAALGTKIFSDFKTTPGNKVTIPFFLSMGPAEKPAEDDRLAVDSLGDKSVQAQVYEVGKAWGITDAGEYRKASTNTEYDDEASSQAARRIAEMVDSDALSCLNNDGTNSIDGQSGNTPAGHDELDDTRDVTLTTVFTGKKGADTQPFKDMTCNVRALTSAFTHLFGDRQNEAKALVLHSRSYTDIGLDATAGIMKADAVSPAGSILKGFMGNVLGKDTFMIDNISTGPKRTITDSAGTTQKFNTRKAFVLKPNPFIFLSKQIKLYEQARDILGRVVYHAATTWYTFYPLHKMNNSDDVRAGGIVFLTDEQTT